MLQKAPDVFADSQLVLIFLFEFVFNLCGLVILVTMVNNTLPFQFIATIMSISFYDLGRQIYLVNFYGNINLL